jgi:hypothetical protein
VTEAEPGYADGWLNVARALIQEGETDEARPFIAQALERDDTLGSIHLSADCRRLIRLYMSYCWPAAL